MAAMYGASALTILSSIREDAFSRLPLEAMACAKPVVISRSGGLTETALDGKTGFIVNKRDEKALAERCMALLRDPELAATFGKAGRRHVLKSFRLQKMVSELAAIYDKALSTRVMV